MQDLELVSQTVRQIVSKKKQKMFEHFFDEQLTSRGISLLITDNEVSLLSGGELYGVCYLFDESMDLLIAVDLNLEVKKSFDPVERGYRWKTLPMGLEVSTKSDLAGARNLLVSSRERVERGESLEIEGSKYARPSGMFDPSFRKGLRKR